MKYIQSYKKFNLIVIDTSPLTRTPAWPGIFKVVVFENYLEIRLLANNKILLPTNHIFNTLK
jgi:hypothetical protein